MGKAYEGHPAADATELFNTARDTVRQAVIRALPDTPPIIPCGKCSGDMTRIGDGPNDRTYYCPKCHASETLLERKGDERPKVTIERVPLDRAAKDKALVEKMKRALLKAMKTMIDVQEGDQARLSMIEYLTRNMCLGCGRQKARDECCHCFKHADSLASDRGFAGWLDAYHRLALAAQGDK